MAVVFDQVVDTVMQLSIEQQEMLLNLLRGWHIEERRREIAAGAQESLQAFRSGQLRPQSAQAIISELQQSLEEAEKSTDFNSKVCASISQACTPRCPLAETD